MCITEKTILFKLYKSIVMHHIETYENVFLLFQQNVF